MNKGGGLIQNYLQFNTQFTCYFTKDIITGKKLLGEFCTEFAGNSAKILLEIKNHKKRGEVIKDRNSLIIRGIKIEGEFIHNIPAKILFEVEKKRGKFLQRYYLIIKKRLGSFQYSYRDII